MNDNTKQSTLKPKHYTVRAPDGSTYLVLAQTEKGAIRDARDHLKQEEKWEAHLSTSDELIAAGRNNQPIINAPEKPTDDGQGELPSL